MVKRALRPGKRKATGQHRKLTRADWARLDALHEVARRNAMPQGTWPPPTRKAASNVRFGGSAEEHVSQAASSLDHAAFRLRDAKEAAKRMPCKAADTVMQVAYNLGYAMAHINSLPEGHPRFGDLRDGERRLTREVGKLADEHEAACMRDRKAKG